MALIQCPECTREVSDTAAACPHCGAPIRPQPVQSAAPPDQPSKQAASRLLVYGGGFLALTIIVLIGFTIYFDRETDKLRDEQRQRIEAKRQAELSKPELPVQIGYRKAVTGPGLVVNFNNFSPRHLALAVTLTNPSLQQKKQYRVDVAPGQTTEIGHLEGWTFASSDIVEIHHNEYRTMRVKLP